MGRFANGHMHLFCGNFHSKLIEWEIKMFINIETLCTAAQPASCLKLELIEIF